MRRSKTIGVKVTPEQAEQWRRAAEQEGRTLCGWLRRVADQAAESAARELATRQAERADHLRRLMGG